MDEQQIDEDAEEAEEEGLLASTGRRFGATWEDVRGRVGGQTSANGSVDQGNREDE